MNGCCDLCTRDFKPGEPYFETLAIKPFSGGFRLCDVCYSAVHYAKRIEPCVAKLSPQSGHKGEG